MLNFFMNFFPCLVWRACSQSPLILHPVHIHTHTHTRARTRARARICTVFRSYHILLASLTHVGSCNNLLTALIQRAAT